MPTRRSPSRTGSKKSEGAARSKKSEGAARSRKSEGATRSKKQAAAPDEEARPGRALWTGTLTFGLVSIPVEMYSATRTVRRSLRMLAPSGTPVVRRYFGGNEREASSLERGYEVEKGKFVVLTEDELESLAPEESRDIAVSRFVDRASIPPLLFDHPYILAPAGKSSSAYRLLADTMGEKRAGIATFVMRGKQYPVAILAEDGLLRAQTLRFADEVRTPASIGLPKVAEPTAAHVKEMTRILRAETKTSVGEKELADPYWESVLALAKKKEKKHADVIPFETEEARAQAEDGEGAEVVDLVALLKRSLGKRAGATRSPSRRKKRAA